MIRKVSPVTGVTLQTGNHKGNKGGCPQHKAYQIAGFKPIVKKVTLDKNDRRYA